MESCGTQTATTKKLCNALRKTGCTKALEALSKEGMSNYGLRLVIYYGEFKYYFRFCYHGLLSFLPC